MVMKITPVALAVLVVSSGAGSALACDSKAEIEAAYAKQQQQKAWRTLVTSKSEAGEQQQTFEYIPPDRVYRKVVVVGQEPGIETISIGQWAWSNQGTGWGEMQPPMAKMINEQVLQTTTVPPKVSVEFSCLGTVAFEGKDYTGYQTKPEKDPIAGGELARTIYVDPATGLPAFNVIGPPGGAAVIREAYSYPSDIAIEKPY